MSVRAIIAFCILLGIVFLAHLFPSRVADYLLPLYMIVAPLVLSRKIKFSFSLRQIKYAIFISLVILVPVSFVLSINRSYHLMGASAMLVQLVRIALPEEIFFRGFLQEVFGNNVKGIVFVSLLFAAAHIPAFFFYRDVSALLTFFPSLVMGFLYMRTSSILPPVLFHFLANVVFRGFMI
ncbi:MAG: CPBP family intramembrane glutamic endopeptidase [Thermodesulfovibrionales bacterium]